MWRRTPVAEVRRSTHARRGTAAMPSVSASASAPKRRSAGSRRWPGRRRRSSAVAAASGGPSPSLPPPTIWFDCRSSSRKRVDGKASRLRQGAGRWRIVEMDVWDKDFLDLVETAHLTFKGAADGEIAFGALKGFLDVRYGSRDDSACAEFSWEGNDENDPASGRGWVVLGTAGRLVGHFYIHNGEDSGFVCDRD